ncbi:NAD synthetase [candidate division TA06 bacterium DG_26]|uniref:Glutamine-dependent NAD(+) synthetase n=1 Tax=candidate division TA06 bacterium DG_26 TaxID=1703771 RepID=A0A0S7WKV3_UNCT6|nr:MAG: NAD synthetase [candidate division TA06 bacterium DG_26]
MKVTIAQLNPVIGDVEGNQAKIKNVVSKFGKESDLVVFSELFLSGYPPRDLLEKPWFIERIERAIDDVTDLSAKHPHTAILLGAPLPTGKKSGNGLYNAAVLIHNGKMLKRQYKSLLPTYDVFDEARYFDPTPTVDLMPFKKEKLGVSICEDAWNDPELWGKKIYPLDPIQVMANAGATLLVNISASPFHVGKEQLRYRILSNHAKKHGIPFAYANQVGGNDELIFDGRSVCVDGKGRVIALFPPFEEHVETVDMRTVGTSTSYEAQDRVESVYEALVLGIRDYMKKCGFKRAVIGLSGGIDSAVSCCLAREAVGKKNVLAVSMPSPYSSRASVEYAGKMAQNLGIEFKVIRISSLYRAFVHVLKDSLGVGDEVDVTLENIQARIRGNILMAISNRFGYLVLSPGNKSELAVGYCTLYGDMSGGLAVISDVPKTMVYELAQYVNKRSEVIPREIIEKPPSAELKPNQLDQDTLPPYDILDPILQYYIEEGYSLEDIVRLDFDRDTVEWVIHAVNRSEYKRRQAPLGLKVTTKAFGVGRRMPIAAKHDL